MNNLEIIFLRYGEYVCYIVRLNENKSNSNFVNCLNRDKKIFGFFLLFYFLVEKIFVFLFYFC